MVNEPARSDRDSAGRSRERTTRPGDRAARLAETQKLKMARSAHAYVRGSTVSFYEWLESGPANVPAGPSVWICGDCHLGNLGPLADSRGHVAVQIRDLDQTVIGNPAHDVIRLALSLASAARGSDLPGVTTARLVERMMHGYETALAGDFDQHTEKALRPVAIRGLLARSMRRRWRHLAAERLDTVKPMIQLGRRFWPMTDEERAAVGELFAGEDVRAMVTRLQSRGDDDAVSLVDAAAYWMKGCSSLGRLRYAAMLKVGKGKRGAFGLLDVKEAVVAAVSGRRTRRHAQGQRRARGDRRQGSIAQPRRADDRRASARQACGDP